MKPGQLIAVRPKRGAGFTLVEVILAVAIAIGLLLVVLYFFQQAAKLREAVLEQTEEITAVRLLLERMAGELQTAHRDEWLLMGITGSSNYIEFVRASLPRMRAWNEQPPSTPPPCDLEVIRYFGGSVLERASEPLLEMLLPPLALEEGSFPISDNRTTSIPLTGIGYIAFRYWNGLEWQNDWTEWDLPVGIEITIAREPWLSDEPEPPEIYRRVVFLPESGVHTVMDPFVNGTEEAGL